MTRSGFVLYCAAVVFLAGAYALTIFGGTIIQSLEQETQLKEDRLAELGLRLASSEANSQLNVSAPPDLFWPGSAGPDLNREIRMRVAEIFSRNQVQIITLTPASVRDRGGMPVFALQSEIRSDEETLLRTLTDLENLRPLIGFNRLSVRRSATALTGTEPPLAVHIVLWGFPEVSG